MWHMKWSRWRSNWYEGRNCSIEYRFRDRVVARQDTFSSRRVLMGGVIDWTIPCCWATVGRLAMTTAQLVCSSRLCLGQIRVYVYVIANKRSYRLSQLSCRWDDLFCMIDILQLYQQRLDYVGRWRCFTEAMATYETHLFRVLNFQRLYINNTIQLPTIAASVGALVALMPPVSFIGYTPSVCLSDWAFE